MQTIKALLFSLFILSFTLWSCEKDEDTPTPNTNSQTEIPFAGTWTRQFEAGPGNLHTVHYYIYQDSIRYTLSGPVGNADYVMLRDTFILDDNRFVGHTNMGTYYVLLTKNITSDSITIYKQEITNINQGLLLEIPNDTTTQHHGWNTFHK